MKTGEIGERAFLDSIKSMIHKAEGAILDFDDDASDFPLNGKTNLVVNVDTFVGKTDWLPGMTPAQVGRKVVVMTLSDLAAKGVHASATMLSLCVPDDYPVFDTQEIIRGFSQYTLKAGALFIGGDLGLSSESVLTGVTFGTINPEGIVARSGTREGDIIAVTDLFGLTSIAFKILLDEMKASESLKQRAFMAAYMPHIKHDLVAELVKSNAISASMDSSDGLGITLNTLADQSNLTFQIDKIPIADGVKEFANQHNLNALDLAMHGGEEFSLVLSIPKDKWSIAVDIAKKQKTTLVRIGTASSGNGVKWIDGKNEITISSKGYDTFREWK
ncbi:MAG: thiamine-phosphate kinase [Candidatus Thorarchaeota archaeon]|jgi:thiamine-monophosphate kinase